MQDNFTPSARYYSLTSLGILDGPKCAVFEFIVNTVSDLLHVPVCLISVIDDASARHFFVASVGLPMDIEDTRQKPLSHSICKHLHDVGITMQFRNTKADRLLAGNLATQTLGAKSYAGAPIYGPDQRPVGAICAIDEVPRI